MLDLFNAWGHANKNGHEKMRDQIAEEIEELGKQGKVMVTYHAKNGQVFSKSAVYYEVQEAMMELSRLAYENETEMLFITIH